MAIGIDPTVDFAFQRLTYYVAAIYSSQLHAGDGYGSLRPAISICVLDRVLFRDVSELHLDFRLRSGHGTELLLTDDLQIHTLELPKYNPGCIDGADASPLDEWIWFLNNAAELTLDEIVRRLKSPIFVKAAGVLDMIAHSLHDRYLYELSLKPARDEAARLEFARLEGEAQGEARGKVIGLIGQLHLLQDLLGQPKTPASALEQTDHVTLQTLVANLQQQLRARI